MPFLDILQILKILLSWASLVMIVNGQKSASKFLTKPKDTNENRFHLWDRIKEQLCSNPTCCNKDKPPAKSEEEGGQETSESVDGFQGRRSQKKSIRRQLSGFHSGSDDGNKQIQSKWIMLW